ncbi:MAG: cytochrome C554 [Candidatus Hydrogenedentes bacterium]|nr:cytochrome C554 [Candidatus Hydrogenedentota bacterium]
MGKRVSMVGKLVLTLGVGMAVCVSALAQEAQREYMGNGACKMCHNKVPEGEQWNKWKAEKHAQAFQVLQSEEAKKVAADKGLKTAPAESPECLKCHVTGYDPEKKAAPASIKMEDGVQCESCHGPNSLHVADAKKQMAAKDKASVDVKKNLVKPDENICKKCHNPENPTWKADRYTTASGEKTGFDFAQAYEKIKHLNPKKAAAPK